MAEEITKSDPLPAPAADARRAAMAVLVKADAAELSAALEACGEMPEYEDIRRPECGLVMIRGRIGGDGPPFHFGEATATRAAIRLASGEVGFGYALGRDQNKARLIALCDALLQRSDLSDRIRTAVLDPLRAKQTEERQHAARRAAATRVEFFTLQRGEDQ